MTCVHIWPNCATVDLGRNNPNVEKSELKMAFKMNNKTLFSKRLYKVIKTYVGDLKQSLKKIKLIIQKIAFISKIYDFDFNVYV